ncbi:hypothetical protein L3X38_042799 [Prunus dulcis]|uniref:Uncharacterized protein n=1 Tax=Prunus dulcis TaxID=3755 RepID=A0AAD4UVV2_PRUDU|nr:hypothetical protein L3X38_042799 [Prunus dulcis]
MEQYFKRKSFNHPSNNLGSSNPPSNNPGSSNPPSNNPASSNHPSNNPPTSHPPLNNSCSPKRSEVTELVEILANLPVDPGQKIELLAFKNCTSAKKFMDLQLELRVVLGSAGWDGGWVASWVGI